MLAACVGGGGGAVSTLGVTQVGAFEIGDLLLDLRLLKCCVSLKLVTRGCLLMLTSMPVGPRLRRSMFTRRVQLSVLVTAWMSTVVVCGVKVLLCSRVLVRSLLCIYRTEKQRSVLRWLIRQTVMTPGRRTCVVVWVLRRK